MSINLLTCNSVAFLDWCIIFGYIVLVVEEAHILRKNTLTWLIHICAT